MLAVAKSESGGSAPNEQLLIQLLTTVLARPAYDYFKDKFDYNNGELKEVLLAFKAARFFSPPQMDEIKPTPAEIDMIKFPFLEDSLLID